MLRVLAVDDNADAAASMALLLRGAWGHDARHATSGEVALELAPAFLPQVALLDLLMPEMDGCELARRLRALPGLERLVLVAITGLGAGAEFIDDGEVIFLFALLKPVEPAHLKEVLAVCSALAGDSSTGR
jgi:two-component system CheB/CheR fusion protein